LHFEGGKGVKLLLKADKTKEGVRTSSPTNMVVGDRVPPKGWGKGELR
jgi:hypothetical protein